MSRTKIFVYNSTSTALLQIVTMVVGFIIPRIMLQYYGSEINGLVSSITQFLGYLTLVEAGLASAAIYSLYKPLAEKNTNEINCILIAANNFYKISGYIFVSLAVILAFCYPYFIQTEKLSYTEVSILVLILGMTSVSNLFILGKYQVLLTADQKIYILSTFSIITIIIQTILTVIFANLNVDIITLRTIILSSIFVRYFLLHFYVKKYYSFVKYDSTPNNKALSKRWDAFYLQVLGTIHTGTPIVIATIFLTLKLVSVFSIYNLVILGISGILSIFTSGLYASFGDVIAKKEQQTLQKAYQEFELAYYMIITIIYSTALIVIMPFIKVYTSGINDENYYLPILGILFVVNGILYNIKTPQGMLVISAGLFKETKTQTTIQGLIAILGGLIFVQYYGIYGILAGPILSNIYRDIDLLIFIPRHVTKLKIRYSMYRILRILIITTFIYFSFPEFESLQNSYLGIFYMITIGAIYSTILVLIVNYMFDKTIFIFIYYRFKKLIFGNR